jgi:transcriptional regulator with XRE-family HTH domain
LAHYTRIRREQLELTIEHAAELSGLELSQWISLEDGWVPEELAVIQTIAAALQVRWSDYYLIAFLCRSSRTNS